MAFFDQPPLRPPHPARCRRQLRLERLSPRHLMTVIEGIVWSDLDKDQQQGMHEPAWPGWELFLDANGNDGYDLGEPLSISDAAGRYHFDVPAPGRYQVGLMSRSSVMQTTAMGAGMTQSVMAPTTSADIGLFQMHADEVEMLVPHHNVTHHAVRSGAWSDPQVWADGQLPGPRARVWISPGIEVAIDGDYQHVRLDWLRVDGTLSFRPDQPTSLLVETIAVLPGGTLQIGTEQSPVVSQTRIVFADNGEIDLAADPTELSRGLVSSGKVTMWGTPRAPQAELAASVPSGATQLDLRALPGNWQVGDQIVIAGTRVGTTTEEMEVRTIVALGTNRLTLHQPLSFLHDVQNPDFPVFVANITRNVVLQSENGGTGFADRLRRAHSMFMHTNDADINHVSFVNMGRTDKRIPRQDLEFDANGNTIANPLRNRIGRYAMHFHRGGSEPTDPSGRIRGVSVVGSIGWGVDVHSSHVNVEDNVFFDGWGAGFVTEAGDEIGAFRRNIALGIRNGLGNTVETSVESDEHTGRFGEGFWLQGPGMVLEDNTVVNANKGFTIFTRGLREERSGPNARMTFSGNALAEILRDQRIPRSPLAPLPEQFAGRRVSVEAVPFRMFNNTAANVNTAVEVWSNYRHRELFGDSTYRSVIDAQRSWNVNQLGILLNQVAHLDIVNAELLGTRSPSSTQPSPNTLGLTRNAGIRAQEEQVDEIRVSNATITDFLRGIDPSQGARFEISGGLLDNVQNIGQHGFKKNSGALIVSRDTRFGSRYHELNDPDLYFRLNNSDLTITQAINRAGAGAGLSNLFRSNPSIALETHLGHVRVGTEELYLPEQSPLFIPFPSAHAAVGIPALLRDQSNQALWNQLGLTIGGRLAPGEARPHDVVAGLIGPPREYEPQPELVSAASSTSPTYRLEYRDLEGVLIQEMVVLRDGWNVLTRTMQGVTRSLFVRGVGLPVNQAPQADAAEWLVPGATAVGTIVGQLAAHDPDGQQLHWSLAQPNDLLAVDGQGEIRLVADPGPWHGRTMQLAVNVHDGQVSQVVLVKITILPMGDINADGAVDRQDAQILFDQWGQAGTADLNADGIIDAADAEILFRDWSAADSMPGAGCSVPTPVATAVPAPVTTASHRLRTLTSLPEIAYNHPDNRHPETLRKERSVVVDQIWQSGSPT